MNQFKKTTIDGIEYASRQEAMKALDISFYMLTKMLKQSATKIPVDPRLIRRFTIGNITFKNPYAAAKFYGIKVNELLQS